MPVNVLCTHHQRLLDSFGHVSFILFILPSFILKTCQLRTVKHSSLVALKTTRVGPLTFVHYAASHTNIFNASIASLIFGREEREHAKCGDACTKRAK